MTSRVVTLDEIDAIDGLCHGCLTVYIIHL